MNTSGFVVNGVAWAEVGSHPIQFLGWAVEKDRTEIDAPEEDCGNNSIFIGKISYSAKRKQWALETLGEKASFNNLFDALQEAPAFFRKTLDNVLARRSTLIAAKWMEE